MNTLKLIVALLIALLCGAGIVFYAVWLRDNWVAQRAPFVKVPADIMPTITKLLGLGETSVLYDLGCGDGRVLIAASPRQEHRCTGIEKGIMPYLRARWTTRQHPGIKIVRQDMFRTKLGDATHVFTYLHGSMMVKLKSKFAEELVPGSIVVSCDFPLPNMRPRETAVLSSRVGIKPHYTLYKYVF